MRLNALRYSFREIRGVWDLTVPEALFTCTVVAELDGDCSSFSCAAAGTLRRWGLDALAGKVDDVQIEAFFLWAKDPVDQPAVGAVEPPGKDDGVGKPVEDHCRDHSGPRIRTACGGSHRENRDE